MASSSLADFSASFVVLLEQSFVKIDELITTRLGEAQPSDFSQDVSNPSFSDLSHAPIHTSLSQDQDEPSLSSSHLEYGKSGSKPMESEHGEKSVSPQNPFHDLVSGLQSAGVQVPPAILDLVRQARDA